MAPNSYILGTRVDPVSYDTAAELILDWAKRHESRFVCVANVHVIMEAHDSSEFQRMLNAADMVTPDGMPLVWTMRRLGHPRQQRVYGPDLTLKLIRSAVKTNIPVGFYGSSPDVLERMTASFRALFPTLQINYSFSPPYRPATKEEDQAIIENINAADVRMLFVGLGCPKQERWIAEHRGKIRAVMLGVGAAFDFHAGTKQQAPLWMKRQGLEWLFRLIQEPARLWRRYLYHNPRFLILIAQQLLGKKS